MAYNPYNDINSIYSYKNAYENDKKSGGNKYNSYAEAAKQYYQNLKNNGYAPLADELASADITTALDILNRYSNSSDTAKTANDILSGSAISGSGLLNPTYTDTSGSAISSADTLSKALADLTANPTAAASNTQGLSNLESLFGLVNDNNSKVNDQSNTIMNAIQKLIGDQTGRYEDLYGYVKNTDFLSTPEGKTIMSYFSGLGGNAANGATAGAAASNGGNIDSYSAANANRQLLDYTNAGATAALNQKNSNASNMLATLQALGVDTSNMTNSMIGLHQGDQNYNLGLAGEYTTGQNNVANQIQAQQDSKNNLIQSGLSYLLGTNTNDSSNYQSQLNAAANIINSATNAAQTENTNKAATAQNAATNTANITQTQLNADLQTTLQSMSGKTAEEQARIAGEYSLKLQELVNAGTLTEQQYNLQIAQIEASSGITEAQIDAAAKKYVSDNETNTTSGTTASDGSQYTVYDVVDTVKQLAAQYQKEHPVYSDKYAEAQAWAELLNEYSDNKAMTALIKAAQKQYASESSSSSSSGSSLSDYLASNGLTVNG